MSTPKTILFLIAKLCVGGSEKKAIRLANHLSTNGYRTSLAFFHGDESLTETIEDGVTVFSPEQQGKFDLKSMLRYRRFVLKQRFNCVVSMGLYAAVLHKVCLLGARHKPKEIVSLNMSSPTPKVKQRMLFYKVLIKKSHIIFGAVNQRQIWEEQYGFSPRSAEVIYNGVDSSYFNPALYGEISLRTRYNYSRDDIVLGVVAVLRPEKAIGDLIAAAAKLREQGLPVKVLVVGDGIELSRLKQEAVQKQMQEHIIFLGAMSDVRPALFAMDIFVLPSVAVETFSNAALEAMASGLPVIISDIGGAREMVEEGVNGAIFPPGDVAILAQTIEALIRQGTIPAMGEASRRLAMERFTTETMISCFQRLINAS